MTVPGKLTEASAFASVSPCAGKVHGERQYLTPYRFGEELRLPVAATAQFIAVT
jgi:hypothetical protein